MRIGHGYDVHRFSEGRDLILGGVKIPSERGLLGHSDADVLLHALMDALLGAAGESDIGRHFPDHDDAFLGISSMELLRRVRDILREKGAEVVNADMTLILQAPKIAPFVLQMEEGIAAALGIEKSRVHVKATTEEHLGFTGRKEGAAAHAVVLIRISI